MLKFEFNFLPDIDGRPFASIVGFAEIITAGRPSGYWSVGRIFVQPVGAEPALLPTSHWIHQPLQIWLLQSNAIEIDKLVRRGVAA